MLAILGTILVSMVLGTNGLLECVNPTENGTRISSDGLCIWLCAQPLCDLLGGPKAPLPLLWNPPGGLPLSGGNAGSVQHRPNFQNHHQNQWGSTTTRGPNGERCQSKCETRLRQSVDRCDSQTLLKVMAEICPNTPLLQVCLTSCGCCALNPPADACMQKCIREHGGVEVLGQLPGSLGLGGLLGGNRPEATTRDPWGTTSGPWGSNGQNQGQWGQNGQGQNQWGQQGQGQGQGQWGQGQGNGQGNGQWGSNGQNQGWGSNGQNQGQGQNGQNGQNQWGQGQQGQGQNQGQGQGQNQGLLGGLGLGNGLPLPSLG